VTVRLLAERSCAAALEEDGADGVALDCRGCFVAVSELDGRAVVLARALLLLPCGKSEAACLGWTEPVCQL